MPFTPSSTNLDCTDEGGTELKKKMKKLRSMKLTRMPSSKSSARWVKTRFDYARVDSVSDDSSLELGRIEFSEKSFREGNESDGASVSSSSRGSTPSTSSSSSEDCGKKGENETRKISKKSRFNQPLTSLSRNAAAIPLIKTAHGSPNYLKKTNCFEGKKAGFQASLHDSESSYSSIDESRKSSHCPKSNSTSSSLKSMQTLRTCSFKPSRTLINKSSFKSRRSSVKKCSQISQEFSVNRATCSSTLKDSKFRPRVELYLGERESKRISVMKVCPYNYCSLHGHHHSSTSTPPLKRLLSKRRRLLKTQKSIKLRSQSSQRAKYPHDIMKFTETSQTGMNRGETELRERTILPVGKEEDSNLSAKDFTKSRMESFRRSREGNEDANLAEVLFGETSYPEKGVQENLTQVRNFVLAEQDILETIFKHKETKFECCCIETSSSILSSKPDESVTTCCDEVPSSNLGFHELENADLKRPNPNDTSEATEDNGVICSASVCQTLEIGAERDEKDEDLATNHESIGQFGPVGDSELNTTSGEVYKSQLHKMKHISMWNLIHQHMISGLDTGAETQRFEGFSDSYQNTRIQNHETDDRESELQKVYAIKMVREAIEKILLPEVQDQSISSDVTSEQELLEKNNGEGDKLTISNSTADKISGPEQEVSASKEGGKSEKKEPKRWSNLKKLILLKRFIKALEKVRKSNPQKSQHFALESDPEAEKVSLKHQRMDRKKSSEEWMLDFALQQVVCELAPTQKRKVELLIKAFETVVPPSDEQQIQVTFPKWKGIRHEASSTRSELDKFVPEPTYRDTKVEDTNGVKYSIIADKQSNVHVDRKAEQEIDEDRKSTRPLKPFDIISTCSEEIPNMNSEFCREDDPERNSKKLEIGNLTGATDEPQSITKRPTLDDMAEVAADNTVISSACDWGPMQEIPAAKEQKYRDSELNNESIEGFGQVRDPEPENSSQTAYKTEFDNEKHVSMWHLIHQHMVAGLAVEDKTKQLDKENDATTLASTEGSGSCPGFGASFQYMGTEYHDTDSQELELHKTYAIKLVREAIEKILLPEVQDQLSDDQSITSEVMSGQEVIEKRHGEGGEPSILTSTDSADPSMYPSSNMVIDDTSLSQEGEGFATANISESENEKTASKVQNKSEKKTTKGWSNLKKWILLKRFIKELEKVKRFNPQKPQNLPLKPDPEAEEVCLRHPIIDERKSAEEWMLDYAIRKVVSELAPIQKRKVALLVKAFETVAPPLEQPQIQVMFPKLEDTDRESCCSESERDKFVSKATEADTNVKDVASSKLDNGDNDSTISDKKADVTVDEEDHQEVHKDTVSSFCLGLLKDRSESTVKNIHLDGLSSVNVEPSYVTRSSSASACDPLEQLIAAKEENGDSDADCTVKVAHKTQFDKQKYISMWHMLCQHVVSGIATKVETRLLDGDDKDEEVDSAKTLFQIHTGSCYEADHDMGREDYDSSSEKTGLSQRDALKLVQEAIEEILLPEIQDDSSDTRSIASDVIPEEDLPEKNHGNVGESILTSIDSPKDFFREHKKSDVEDNNRINQEEKGFSRKEISSPDEEIAVSIVGNKSDQQKPRKWSKVKKLILLKRSIKALEKARRSNLQAPKNLLLKSEPEKDKVDLRHQLKDEKKKAEEWMLDYAVQNLVSTLTPARKRRVSMLVEAFEAFVPLPEM